MIDFFKPRNPQMLMPTAILAFTVVHVLHIAGSGSMSLENFSPAWYLLENHQAAR